MIPRIRITQLADRATLHLYLVWLILPLLESLKTLPDQWLKGNFSSTKKWTQAREMVTKEIAKGPIKKTQRLREALHNIVLHYTYPRIDLEVSKHMNHLLKSPFCVHPGTGKVCVPIDPSQIRDFDPANVPDVRDLLRELDKDDRSRPTSANPETTSTSQSSWNKTSLKPYVEIFERHVDGILRDKLKKKKGEFKSCAIEILCSFIPTFFFFWWCS